MIWESFTDPVLRGPVLGSMLMCFAAAFIGVLVFLRKQSLVGEALSHSAYPGVIVGVMSSGLLTFDRGDDSLISLLIIAGAFSSALLGLWCIYGLEKRGKIRSDSALCFILSTFFGIGITLASYLQFSQPGLYRKAQAYLYGQAATMTDMHIAIYGALALVTVITVLSFAKELEAIAFDRDFAESMGISVRLIQGIVFVLTVLAVVVGIRSVGVVLMSAMLIAPAAAARQFTHKLTTMLWLASGFGLLSGYLGVLLSDRWTHQLALQYPGARLILPTGPMIVIIASIFCVLSLLFAPERGLILRLFRIAHFRYRCMCENLLKAIWRHGPSADVTFDQILQYQSVSKPYLWFVLQMLVRNGWLERSGKHVYRLTSDGRQRAAHVVRLHRLWEVYLVDYLGVGAERVHRNAEEMEHILTPELERELTALLKNPQIDPHQQKIPSKGDL